MILRTRRPLVGWLWSVARLRRAVPAVLSLQVVDHELVVAKVKLHGVERLELFLDHGLMGKVPAPPWAELTWLVYSE